MASATLGDVCLRVFQAFQNENSPKQNEHCLRNFDLSEYRQILSDLAVWVYQGLIKFMQNQIHPMIGTAELLFDVRVYSTCLHVDAQGKRKHQLCGGSLNSVRSCQPANQ